MFGSWDDIRAMEYHARGSIRLSHRAGHERKQRKLRIRRPCSHAAGALFQGRLARACAGKPAPCCVGFFSCVLHAPWGCQPAPMGQPQLFGRCRRRTRGCGGKPPPGGGRPRDWAGAALFFKPGSRFGVSGARRDGGLGRGGPVGWRHHIVPNGWGWLRCSDGRLRSGFGCGSAERWGGGDPQRVAGDGGSGGGRGGTGASGADWGRRRAYRGDWSSY